MSNPVLRKDYRPPPYRVERIDLSFDLFETEARVRAEMQVRRGDASAGEPLVLAADGNQVEAVEINGAAAPPSRFAVADRSLTVLDPPDEFTLAISARVNAAANTTLMGLYVSHGNYFTQCEAEGFRKIIPYLDRPDVTALYSTTIRGDPGRFPVMLSNGNLVAEQTLTGGRREVKWVDPFRKPSYLFALVAGRFACYGDEFTTASGRKVRIELYTGEADVDKCRHAVESLKRSMRWDEETYGLEYDLDRYMIVAVPDFNMGAMENKGLNVFNTKYVLANPAIATDRDYLNVEGVIGHEYFHNWTGNRVTCRDWFQLSLKEGLTVFRDQEFSADMGARAVKRIDDVRVLRAHQFTEDAGPMAHPVRPDAYQEISNFYTATVYNKGAEVVRMIQTIVGRDGFRAGLRLYLQRHDGAAVTIEDFVAAMEDANGADLGQFRRWYGQAGTPRVRASWRHDGGEALLLELQQSCPPTPGQSDKAPFDIPLAVGLVAPDGSALPVADAGTTEVLRLRETRQEFRFAPVPAGTLPSLGRGFSAPVQIEADYSDRDLGFLSRHDTDPFNRWEALQQLALRVILRRADTRGDGGIGELLDAYGALLDDGRIEPMFLAHALSLPDESFIAEQMPKLDPDALNDAVRSVSVAIARHHRRRLETQHEQNFDAGPYQPEPAAIGRRALRNVCLAYLMELDDDAVHARCIAQYRGAGNMTERLAALQALAHSNATERAALLAEFYAEWENEPLVIDKWFRLQAVSRRAEALDTVRSLTGHRAFDARNPNKVHALIGAFCHGNLLRFHAADGGGYRFLAQWVIDLDAKNPQLAARLVAAFNRWRKFDPARQTAMRHQMELIRATEGLSPDVGEILGKNLSST